MPRSSFPGVRAHIAFALAAVAVSLALAGSADGKPHPQAYAATLHYLDGSTSSCAGQSPVPGGLCTQLNTFTTSMQVVGRDRYRIEVANADPKGNFRYFAWILADGMTLTRIVHTRGGDCGPDSGMISCARTLAVRGCGCTQGNLVVDFTAAGRAPTRAPGGYWIHYGLVTPYLDVPTTFTDAPICEPGQKGTSAHPCIK